MAVERRDFVAPFQEAIRCTYPVLRQEQTQLVEFGPNGAASAPTSTVWRFHDLEGRWRCSLAPDFIALESSAYASRSGFLSRYGGLDRRVAPAQRPLLGAARTAL